MTPEKRKGSGGDVRRWLWGFRKPGRQPSQPTEKTTTAATGLRRPSLCSSFWGKGFGEPLLLLPDRPPLLISCVGEAGGTTTARKAATSTGPAVRQPTTKATAATQQRLPARHRQKGGEGRVGLQTMSIAGHISRAGLSRYSHVRMEAKRRALDEIAARQCAADEKRKEEAEQKQAAAASQPAMLQ